MSTLGCDVTTLAQEPELLELHETASAGPVRSDGLVPLHVIRPGIGRGKGKHLYEAEMLEREVGAGRFTGWPMYLDHLDPQAKKRAAGLPRSIRDLAGQIKEAWWDPNVPNNERHGRGAVVALARVNSFVRSLITDLGPEAVGASISATASGVRPVNRGGQQVWLVEGINPRGSVDFVTEAGAGGRVISIVEALEESMASDQEVFALLEGKSDREVIELLEAEGLLDRPGIRSALLEQDDDGEEVDDAREKVVQKYLKKFRGNRAMAEKAADRELAAQESHDEGGEDVTIEDLQEALETEEGQALLESLVGPLVEKRFGQIVAPKLAELIESALEDERELTQAEADAVAGRKLELRDLRDMAHRRIAEASLPEPFKAELRAKYDLYENKPAPALDVVDDDPEAVEEPKSASEKVTEAVEADLAVKDEQFRASRPATRVRGQGARADREQKPDTDDGDGNGKVEEADASKIVGGKTAFVLNEAGVEVDDDLYEGILR